MYYYYISYITYQMEQPIIYKTDEYRDISYRNLSPYKIQNESILQRETLLRFCIYSPVLEWKLENI